MDSVAPPTAQTRMMEVRWKKKPSALLFTQVAGSGEMGVRVWCTGDLSCRGILMSLLRLCRLHCSGQESHFGPKMGEHCRNWNLSADTESSMNLFLLTVLLFSQLAIRRPFVSFSYLMAGDLSVLISELQPHYVRCLHPSAMCTLFTNGGSVARSIYDLMHKGCKQGAVTIWMDGDGWMGWIRMNGDRWI